MMSDAQELQVREAVGVFESEDALQGAIDDLLSHGFNRAEISLLAATDSVEKKLDTLIGGSLKSRTIFPRPGSPMWQRRMLATQRAR